MLAGTNLFSYCNNAPINHCDFDGKESTSLPSVYIPSLPLIDYELISSFFLGLSSVFSKLIPWGIAGTILLTPIPTANDEAIINSITILPEYDVLKSELERAKGKSEKSEKTPKYDTNSHHIVPRTKQSEDAIRARAILSEARITINGDLNTVDVSTKMHWFMHTNIYVSSVYTILHFAQSISPKNQHATVSMALGCIKDLIRNVDKCLQ